MNRRTLSLLAAMLLGISALATGPRPAAAATFPGATQVVELPGAKTGISYKVGDLDYVQLFAIDTKTYSLWVTDGTAVGTAKLLDLAPFGSIQAITSAGERVVFNTRNTSGIVLWVTDGTAAGTTQLRSFPSISEVALVGAGPLVYFTPVTGSRQGSDGYYADMQLWRSDGTADGTFVLTPTFSYAPAQLDVRTMPPPPGGGGWSIYSVNYPIAVGSALLFNVIQGPSARQLWRSDGTVAGTRKLADDLAICGQVTVLATGDVVGPTASGRWLFCGQQPAGQQIWSVDSGASELRKVTTSPRGARARPLALLGGEVLIDYDDVVSHRLWFTDGTPGVARPGATVRSPFYLTFKKTADGRPLMFSPGDAISPQCLWRGDGTYAESEPIWCSAPPAQGGLPTVLGAASWPFANGLLFTYPNGVLWYSDGTARGTRRVATHVYEALGVQGSTFQFLYFEDFSGPSTLLSFPGGPAGYVRLPERLGGPPAGEAHIPIVYGTNGSATASLTLTLTLPAGATYLGDDSGVVPTVVGQQVTWQLPALALLEVRGLDVRVGLPAGALGTTLPVSATVTTAEPSADTSQSAAQGEIMLAQQVFLPLSPADGPLDP